MKAIINTRDALPCMEGQKCFRCFRRQPVSGLGHCQGCLSGLVEDRSKKAVSRLGRVMNIIIASKSKNSLGCVAAVHVLRKIIGRGMEFSVASPGVAGKIRDSAVVLPECADDAAAEVMVFLVNARTASRPSSSRAVRIFEAVTEKELLAYARMKNLKYTTVNGRGDGLWLKRALQGFQESHPGTIESVARSGAKLREIE